MYLQLLVLILALAVNAQQGYNTKLTEVFRWTQVDFQFPNDTIRNSLINSKRYIQANNNMLGLEVWNNKLFITVPRWFTGTGSTLNYVNLNSVSQSPLLIPYPNYDMNDIYSGNLENKIISATRIFVDACNRLWVPDNGQEGAFLNSPTVLASHKLLVFDLNTNTLLRKITIGKDVKRELSSFYEVVVDITNNNCNKAYAYLADTIGYGIVVYSWETNTLRRITNSYFYFEPQSSVFNGVQFNDGVMGLALSPVNPDGYKTLYFHALASYFEYNVSTRVLKDENLSSDFNNYKLVGSRGPNSQSTNQRLDAKTGVLFYTQVLKNGIGCWNSRFNRLDYCPETNSMAVVDQDRITFPSALTLDSQRNIWLMSNNLMSFAASTLNPNEYNYRVLYSPVDTLIKGTICDAFPWYWT